MKKLASLLLLLFTCISAPAQPSKDTHPWWQHAVFYEIYPRSFADSDNNGMGDINGITSKLDYLQDLGIDAIWITPCFPSPQVDFGYDVSDYRNIAPEYGTLADMDRLIAEAKKRNIRIVLDLVVNHTSDKHPWFIDSRSSRTSKYRDWYMWRDGKDGKPPSNWQAWFGGSAWKWDDKTKQYYYHYFYAEQPDLNWHNPAVSDAIMDVARFWFDRGVAGFRLDAVDTLFEDPTMADNPIRPGKNFAGDPNMDDIHNKRLPEMHGPLRQLRKVADQAGERVLIGETGGKDIAALSEFYGPNNDEVQLPMNFFFTHVNKLSPEEFRKQITAWDKNPKGGWPVWVLSNHDIDRHYNRYGDGKNNDQIAKVMAALLLTLRGTALMYYGEEIGMENNDPKRKEDVLDPVGRYDWPYNKGRDGERTPMQWNTAKNAGFSTKKPWLPVPLSYKTHNVAVQGKDQNSILHFYKKLLKLRGTNPALLDGEYVAVNEDDQNVLAYLRKLPDRTVVVALNMTGKPQTVTIKGGGAANAQTLLTTAAGGAKQQSLEGLKLEAFGVFVGEVTK